MLRSTQIHPSQCFFVSMPYKSMSEGEIILDTYEESCGSVNQGDIFDDAR